MPLTKAQQAQLEELQAERDAPPVRTGHGLAGILHHLIDVTSGRVPHVSPERVDELHDQAEELAGDGQAAGEAQPVEDQGGGDGQAAD